MTGTPQYVQWLTQLLRPNLGDRVLEVGAGIGNLAGRMMGKRQLYLAAEKDPLYLHALRNRFLRTPNVRVRFTLKLFDKTVWFWKRIDPLLPWPGLTLFAVATRR
jgi:hypothetical protein